METKRCYGCMEQTDREVCPRCGWSAGWNNASHQLPVGTLLKEQYLVGRVLGQGGFGITYLGWDTVLDTPVAIKEFYPRELVTRDHTMSTSVMVYTNEMGPAFTAGRDRILREAKALAMLRGIPQIVGVQNCFNANGTAYIIMEYVRGMDLVRYVQQRGGRLTMAQTLQFLVPVMDALEKVHKQGLIHRDISPDNIMLDMEGNAKLLDFGAVRSVEAPDLDAELSHSTEAIVKHGFAPTEQYRSRGSLGPWTDEYALCATIWFCLTGSPPPDALSLSMEDEVLERSAVPGLTDAQWEALRKGMSPRARDRFGDLALLRQALLGQTSPTSAKPEKEKKKKKGGLVAGIIAAVLTLALLGGGVALWYLNGQQLPAFLGGTTAPETTAATTEATEKPTTQATTEAPEPSTEATTEATTEPATEAATEAITEPTTEATEAPTEAPEPWEANLLAKDPFTIMGLSREGITSVEFRSRTSGAPKKTYDISKNGDGSVLGWIENGAVVIAGNGGVNGEGACSGLFSDCVRLKKVTFGGNFHTEKVTDMSFMFCRCPVLETVDTENLDTSSVITMESMFDMHNMKGSTVVYTPDGNHVLRALDTSTWDVSKVENMSNMFYYCNLLVTVGCWDWDTSSVTDMSGMFSCCTEMTQVDVADWDTGNVKNMSNMFFACGSMTRLDIADWDVGNVKDMSHMFDGCSALRILAVENWNTGNVQDMSYMFTGCSTLESPQINNWDVSSLQNAACMFQKALWTGDFDLSSWNTSKLKNVSYMFDTFYRGITIKGVSQWDRRNLTGYASRYESFAPWALVIDGKDWIEWFK